MSNFALLDCAALRRSDIALNNKKRKKIIIVYLSITSILKLLMILAIWLALISAIYSRITPFFALSQTFFFPKWESFIKTQQPIRFQGFFKETNHIVGKRKKTFPTFYKLAQY